MACILRENFVFKIVPMANPDGVFLGNNRCNLVGQDLNRCWNVSSEFSSPTILAIKEMLKEIDNSEVNSVEIHLSQSNKINHINSAIKLTSSSISMRTLPSTDLSYMETHTKMSTAMNDI